MKNILLFIILSSIITTAFAETCPTVDELKSQKLKHWKAYDSDDNKALSAARESKLKEAIKEFVMAEWTNTGNKNVIHCYYHNAHGSSMEAYFAKESAMPSTSSKYWYQVSGMMQCAASAEQCQFQALPNMTTQLASKES